MLLLVMVGLRLEVVSLTDRRVVRPKAFNAGCDEVAIIAPMWRPDGWWITAPSFRPLARILFRDSCTERTLATKGALRH
jgi:hypothetical protein